ncbi:hypothetical protein F441_07771 [Phytophthora nicotianae CJ01A1]|uniref:SWIM-type domain-containing protein n=1 Tax=Phytophthora nicotianae CJ01A1 TaxID=1317063 RepID=W2X5B5_PHYNI|nr:hypothetical protein F441_07771 [Phytophthora nicotianae CJ01A1]
MGNQTNNRLESSWQKLKTLVNRSTSLDDCVVSILFWQTVNEKLWCRGVSRIGVYVNVEYDDEMNRLLNTVSRHAVELIKQQYDFALKADTEYRYYPVGSYVIMHYTARSGDDIPDEYMLNPDAWTCSCMFRVTRLLPCRHIIYYRKVTGCSSLVPKEIIHRRWLFKNYRKLGNGEIAEDEVVESYEHRPVPLPVSTRAKNQNEKFKELLGIGRQIADVGAHRGTKAHTDLCESLKKFLHLAQAGNCSLVVRRSETGATSEDQATAISESVPQTQKVSQSSTGTQTEAPQDNDAAGEGPVNSDVEELVEGLVIPSETPDSEKRPPVRPRWMISKTTNKSGRVKISAATRRKAINSNLNQSARFEEAVAAGLDPSVGVLLEAIQAGITYRQVETLRSLTILQQTRNTKITVFERRNKPETNAYKLRTVLPLRRIESCEAQVAQFQNRWYCDHETRMPQMGLQSRQGAWCTT